MKNLQKSGGIFAWVHAVVVVLLLMEYFVLLPSLGITMINEFNAADVLPIFGPSPLLNFGFLLVMLSGVAVVVVSSALSAQLRSAAPSLMEIARAVAIIAAVLFVATTTNLYGSVGPLATLYPDPAAEAGYLAISLTAKAFFMAGNFAYSWFVLLVSWVALQSRRLPERLNYLGLLTGVIGIIAYLIPPLGLYAEILLVFWLVGLGFHWLKDPKKRLAPVS